MLKRLCREEERRRENGRNIRTSAFDGDEDIAPKLYRRRYVTTVGPRLRYYAVFTDYQRKRRKFAVGKNLKAAIKKLYEIDKKNDNEVDFDEQTQKRAAKGMTLRSSSSSVRNQ